MATTSGKSRALNIIREMGNYEESELNFRRSSHCVVVAAFSSSRLDDGARDMVPTWGNGTGGRNKQMRSGYCFSVE